MGQPFFLSQCSIADDDLFGSGEDDSDDACNQNSAMETDDVFRPTSSSDHVVPSYNDDVFLRRPTDQVVPELSSSEENTSENTSSSSADLKREYYRRSRESGNLEENGIRRSFSLPDIVPKEVENATESVKNRRQNLSDNSPDVVSSSENKTSDSSDTFPSMTTTREIDSILRQPNNKRKKLSRSVSFQEKKGDCGSFENKDIPTEQKEENVEHRRQNFRSSGYGTGDSDKNSSVQSQASQVSVFDGDDSNISQEGTSSDILDSKSDSTVYKNYGCQDEQMLSPSTCSNESGNERKTMKSVYRNEPNCDMMPLLSEMNQSSVTVDNPPNDETGSSDKAGSNSSIQIHSSDQSNSSRQMHSSLDTGSNSSIQIPNVPDFDVLLNEPNSSTGLSTSDSSDSSLTHVQKKYCHKQDKIDSKSPPSFATCLPSAQFTSADTGLPSSISNFTMPSATDYNYDYNYDYKSHKEYLTKEILQQDDISEAQKLELIESPITPRDYLNALSQRITSETVERSSRCRDVFCKFRTCSKVREGFIGLDHTLEGRWPYGSSPDVSDLCCSLGKHSTAPCDELKCAVRWCYFLSAEFSDQPRGEFVYRALKRQYDMPVLSAKAFPSNLRPSKFYKLDEHYRRDKPVYSETMTTFGDYGNVYMMDDLTVIKKIKFQNYDCDIDNTVYRQLCNRQHKHIVDHIWAAVYLEEEEIHVCTTFFRGGTLEDLLQRRSFLNPVIVKEYMLQILDALIYLHDKCRVIYLYWTTSNILFLDPVRRHILISNLSLSVPSNSEFDVGYIKQSLPPCLTPPELISGEDGLKLSPVTDSWGLGCMMLEMLTGKQMWYNERHEHKTILTQKIKNKGINPEQYIPRNRLPEIFSTISSQCLEFNFEKRISCAAIQHELKNWKYD